MPSLPWKRERRISELLGGKTVTKKAKGVQESSSRRTVEARSPTRAGEDQAVPYDAVNASYSFAEGNVHLDGKGRRGH